MNIMTLIAESLQSLSKNKVRSTLSMLGIVIGVASVIAMVAIGEGAKQRVREQIKRLGDDWLIVGFWGVQRGGVFRFQGVPPYLAEQDARAIRRECSAVRASTPSNTLSEQVVSSFGNYQTRVMGVYPDYLDIRRWNVIAGTPFTEEDDRLRRRVCLIGKTAAEQLFGTNRALGQTIRIKKIPFEIIGLLEEKGNDDGRDFDDIILFPWQTFQRQIAGNEISQTMFVAAKPGMPLAVVKQQIRSLLRQRHRLLDDEDDDFRIIDRALSAQANAEATRTFNYLLMAVASISLLVGGVGIMNIMLVSVTERTREIGLRMAIGAHGGHVLGQFLAEAVVLCGIGGLLGFFGGWGVSELVRQQAGWDTYVSYWMALVAVGFATAVGLFFGFYPAWRASGLHPIEALRYE